MSFAVSPTADRGFLVRPNYGRCATEAEALDLLVQRLSGALDPHAIWLFGSRARGTARPDSDFDLLVVAKRDGSFDGDDYDAVDLPIRETRIGCDVVPCDLETFEASLQLPTSFVYQIVHSGRLVYGGSMS